MREFRIRADLKRAAINGFAFPLGIEPGDLKPPTQGFTLSYTPGEEDEPDTYVFHIVVSHEKLAPILHRAFEMLADEVYGIVEIGSRDAYRSVDVYVGEDAVQLGDFLRTWNDYEVLLLEDGAIAAGANSEEPFVEVFIDHSKGLYIHVPLTMRDDVEAMLQSFSLEEVAQTWPDLESDGSAAATAVRPILDLQDEYSPDIDELLLQLRHDWQLELNVDPQINLDEGGRELGQTLWHAVVVVQDSGGDPEIGGYVSIWATAASLTEMEGLIEQAMNELPQWRFVEVYTVDRVAFDERPDELSDLPPKRQETTIHLVQIDPWPEPPPGVSGPSSSAPTDPRSGGDRG
jgi:hypothetical protein